jgi:hypothetical protein
VGLRLLLGKAWGSKGKGIKMSFRDQYVIEARNDKGELDLTKPQPESFFGRKAITGISSNEMSHIIFKKFTDAILEGNNIMLWPKIFDTRFVARKKYW